MRIAFAIVKLFSGGGLQRDCAALARLVAARGQEVTILTSEHAPSPLTEGLTVEILPVAGRTNHGRQAAFANAAAAEASRFDLLVGFNKLSCLDVLYCADPAIAERLSRQPWLGLLPRYRTYWTLEGLSFKRGRDTRLLLLATPQANAYREAWDTEPERITVLPPTVAKARRRPEFRRDGTRERLRGELGLGRAQAWLTLCVQPHTKGLDRTVEALRARPDACVLVAGLAETDKAAADTVRLAKKRGVADQILWLGHREDVPELMAAADLLVHPARADVTGTVILEAVVNGLPVITTSLCGYAEHVLAADAGEVSEEPFSAVRFAEALARASDPARLSAWSRNGAAYGENPNLYAGRDRAAELIVTAAALKLGPVPSLPGPGQAG